MTGTCALGQSRYVATRNACWLLAVLTACQTYADVGIATVRQNEPDLRPCLQEAASRDPNLRGTLALEFEVDAAGKVLAVRAPKKEDLFGDPDLTKCLQSKASGWTFPAPGKTKRFPYKFSVVR